MTGRHWALLAIVSVVAAIGWMLHMTLLSGPLTADEGVHLVLSRALADGAGYPLDGLRPLRASVPIPPLVPLWLATVWHLGPSYPANLPYFALPSALSALGIVLVLPSYLVRLGVPASAAVASSVLTATSPLVMRQATSIVSALPFGLFLLLALVATERAAEPGRRLGAGVLAGTCAGLAALTRWLGVPAVFVLGIQLARRSDRERAAGFCYGAVLTTLPWVAWLVAYGRLDGVDPASLATEFEAVMLGSAHRLAALPALTAMTTLPGFSEFASGSQSLLVQALLYAIGAAMLVAAWPTRFGAVLVASLVASVLIPTTGFPMGVTPLLVAALVCTITPTQATSTRQFVPATVVLCLLLTAGLGHYHYWTASASKTFASGGAFSVATSPTPR